MKILVANRGEIAVRILRACRELDLQTVAIYTPADELAQHVRTADEAIALPERNGYLDIEAVINAARSSGAQAIHPGYGFLSENSTFARTVEEAGMIFIGPEPATLDLTGDKLAARRCALKAELPVLPGTDQPIKDISLDCIPADLNFPLLVKACAGGGGRGIRLVQDAAEFSSLAQAAQREALANFGSDEVYLEALVSDARHIEVQIIGDGKGTIITLGERECSLQRRRQKLVEEAPACGLSQQLRETLYQAAIRLGKELNYRSLGTVEFLLDPQQNPYFIEVNPRIQVEHPVTELISGIDLVREQLRLALTGELHLTQQDICLRGHAIEARILAEDPEADFMPSIGTINFLREPSGAGIRVDSALYTGMPVTTDFDSLLAKLITWDENRDLAISRMKRALQEFYLSGIATDLQFLQTIIEHPDFRSGQYNTGFLEHFSPADTTEEMEELAIAAAMFAHQQNKKKKIARPAQTSTWLTSAWREQIHNH